MRDFYELLELAPSAPPEEIKTNYRRLAMKWHPDRNAGSKEAEERFKAISEAYATLSDPDKRRRYDEYRAAGSYGPPPGPEAAAGQQGYGAYGPFGFGFGFAGQEDQAREGGDFFAGGFGARREQPREDRYAGFESFTAKDAADMFTREMYALAIELTMQNVGWRDIAAELVSRGCPAEVASEIARKIEVRRKEVIRGRAKPYFVRSALSGFMGFSLLAFFGGFGLMGLLGLGMFLSGGYNLVRALYFIATGNAPRTAL